MKLVKRAKLFFLFNLIKYQLFGRQTFIYFMKVAGPALTFNIYVMQFI